MERRNFLQTTGLFAAFGMLPSPELLAQPGTAPAIMVPDSLQPFLMPPMPPLSHKGNMESRAPERRFGLAEHYYETQV